MIDLKILDEVGELDTVVAGVAFHNGEPPALEEAYDAKTYHTILHNQYPLNEDLNREVEAFVSLMEREGVTVLRPGRHRGMQQIFARDVGFVIGDTFVRANIIADREQEMKAYDAIWSQIDPDKIVTAPDYVSVEGGDVTLLRDGRILLGCHLTTDFDRYSTARTNKYAIGFLKGLFPEREIIPLQLIKDDHDPYRGVLHLDCAFQPVGEGLAIIFPGAFRHYSDYEFLVSLFGPENVFSITREEFFEMNTNIFSLSPQKVIIDSAFARLKGWLEARGLEVLTTPYREVSKLGGLLRCTTQPLVRRY